MKFELSDIRADEVPTLLELIHELARFERLEVQASVESLRESFFGPQPAAGALLASCGGEAVGYAIYFFTFSSFVGRAGLWLEDIYVRPAFRNQGLGRALFRAVAGIGAARNCGRFEWTVLNWNQNALDFYERLGARRMGDWVLLRLDEHGLRRLSRAKTSRA